MDHLLFDGGVPDGSSPALRFKPKATFVRSPLAGTGVPEADNGAGDASLTILEKPGLGAGEPVVDWGGGDIEADAGSEAVGKEVKLVMSTT